MLKDGRNFRSSYYEKVGFRNIDDSKYLDVILASKDLDLNRLSQFCLRFTVPGVHRALVWKLVLSKCSWLSQFPFTKYFHRQIEAISSHQHCGNGENFYSEELKFFCGQRQSYWPVIFSHIWPVYWSWNTSLQAADLGLKQS